MRRARKTRKILRRCTAPMVARDGARMHDREAAPAAAPPAATDTSIAISLSASCTRAALRTVWSRRPRVCSRRGTGASQPASSVFVDCKHCCTRDLKKTWSRGRLRRPKPPGSSTSPVAGGEAQFVHFGLGAKHSRGDHVVAADQGHPLDQRRPGLRPRWPPRQVAVGRFEPAGARAASDPGPSPRDDPRAPPPARHTPRAQTLRPPTL